MTEPQDRPRCIVINLRSAIALVAIFIISGIRHTNQMVDSKSELEKNSSNTNNSNNDSDITLLKNDTVSGNSATASPSASCVNSEEKDCSSFSFPCIRCNYNYSCLYGRELNVTCQVMEHVQCKGERTFVQSMKCRYCYQTELWQQTCVRRGNCNAVTDIYRTNCTANADVYCLGNRSFTRNVRCNWTQGYRWSTALIISITLGGFGVDRFYLGHWQEGIGKLFSFGGLGVWTIMDVLLISLHYLGPADGSLYI